MELAKKENEIEQLKHGLVLAQLKIPKTVSSKQFIRPSSVLGRKTSIKATQGRHHVGVTKARQAILRKLSGVIHFEEQNLSWVGDPSLTSLGSGQFEDLKLIKIVSLGVVAAAKVCNTNISIQAAEVDTIVGMTVSGHRHFTYVYGIYKETTIIMQFFGDPSGNVAPTLHKHVHDTVSAISFRKICFGIMEGFLYFCTQSLFYIMI